VARENPGGSTVHRRQLGRRLRNARTAARLSLVDAAAAVSRSTSTLSRIESGDVPTRGPEVRLLCEVYEVNPAMTAALVALASETSARGWWHSYGDVIPGWFNVFLGMEETASEFRRYEPELVPGLFQTEAYARAVIATNDPDVGDDEIDRRVSVRRSRQVVVTREAARPTFRVVLNEAVIRRPVGGPHVMKAQCLRLAELSELPHIDLRVVPFSVGQHPGMNTGAFVVLRFPGHGGNRLTDPPTVYVEGYSGALYLDQEQEVARYDQAFDRIVTAAGDSNGDKSREILWKAAQEAHA